MPNGMRTKSMPPCSISLDPHSPVEVIYSPMQALRSLHIVALGSVLAESSWSSRIPAAGDAHRDTLRARTSPFTPSIQSI